MRPAVVGRQPQSPVQTVRDTLLLRAAVGGDCVPDPEHSCCSLGSCTARRYQQVWQYEGDPSRTPHSQVILTDTGSQSGLPTACFHFGWRVYVLCCPLSLPSYRLAGSCDFTKSLTYASLIKSVLGS